jgi:N6-L-threonylcarbamoyladenine synthase
MTLLGIETSCDETSAAVVRGKKILSNVVSTQVPLHQRYQGVVPELASRAHCERLPAVIGEALRQAFGKRGKVQNLAKLVDGIAFTQGPGLNGALLTGKVAAEALARAQDLPLVGVNHLEAHALAMRLAVDVPFPFLALIVSGGHTELVQMKKAGQYRVLGRTRDDAVGEVYDKVAKFLRLGYPGGPIVDRLAATGDPQAVAFKRPLMPGGWEFSFSGLKTAVLYHVRDAGYAGREVRPAVPIDKPMPKKFIRDLCASFQEAIVDTLIEKSVLAARKFKISRIVVGGGVAANRRLREKFAARAKPEKISVAFPPMDLCTDNAAMIAYAGALKFRKRGSRFAVDPSMEIRSWR